MKLTIGWPSISPNAPSWKTATVAPRVASTREQEAEGRGQRHQDRAEHDHQQEERQPDHDGQVDRQRVAEPLGHVGRDRGQAGDPDRRCRSRSSMPAWPSRRSVSRSSVRGVVRAGRRGDQDLRAGARRSFVRDDLGVGDVVLAGGPARRPRRTPRRGRPSAMSRPSTTTSSGPSRPGPNASAIRSDALRCVVSRRRGAVGRERQVQVLAAGSRGRRGRPRPASTTATGARPTKRAQRTPLLRILPSLVALRVVACGPGRRRPWT